MTLTRIATPDRPITNRLDRRRLLGGAAATASAAALGGRFGSALAQDAPPAPSAPSVSEPVELQFWGGEPEESGPGDLVAAFNELYPNITAKYTRYVNDDTGNTQLDTALQGGAQIDVYQSYGLPRLGARIRAEAAEDLTPYIEADEAILAWTQAGDPLYQFEGRFFSLPTVRAPYLLIANKQLLDDAGVTLPEQWTIDEFRAMAQEVSGDGVYGVYMPPDVARQILGPDYWYKEGGTESNFDDPAFRQFLELHGMMIEEGSAFPWTDVLAQNLRVYQQNIFLTGQAVFWINSAFVLRYVNDLEEFPHDFVTTFGTLPTPAGVEQPWNQGGISNEILMSPQAQNKEAAWALIRYRLVEGAHHYLKAAKEPAFPGVVEPAAVVEGILGPDRETLYDVAAFERANFDPNLRLISDSISTAGAEIMQIFQGLQDRYLIGEISLDEALAEMKSQSDEAIQRASA
jgi:multiple sugar transport system substrate-binding protein